MSQIFKEDGKVIPVTAIEAGPVFITQLRTKDKDGYEAVQVGFGVKKEKNIKKPQLGHLKKAKIQNTRYSREFIIDKGLKLNDKELKLGEAIDVSIFQKGDKVKVSGISKAKGFQGVMKRHGFHGAPASHGHKHVARSPGSIGRRFPQHTVKGMRMAGRMGGERVTVRGLEVIDVNKEKNLMFVKGAVPGRKGILLEIVSL